MKTFPKNLVEVKGDLLKCPDDGYVIVHQCNCLSSSIAGLAYAVYKKYPEANTRNGRKMLELFGTYSFVHPVVNLFSQKYPGKDCLMDKRDVRLQMFDKAFRKFLLEQPKITRIALPKGIGCGLAGGNWETYLQVIIEIVSDYPDREFILVDNT